MNFSRKVREMDLGYGRGDGGVWRRKVKCREEEGEKEEKEEEEKKKFLHTDRPTKGSTRGPRGPKKGICSALPICKILWAEPVVSIAYGTQIRT